MHNTKDELYEQIKEFKSKEDFEKEIKKKQKEYDDLIDEETIALLIVDELGKNKQDICKISDLQSGSECTVFGRITNINESRNFTRKNGSAGKVINLEITDDTGSSRLVLWNKDVELVKNKTIKIGTCVKVINSYIKDGYTGLEINLGRWGLIEIEPVDIPEVDNIEVDSNIINGTLNEIEPTRAFFKDNGEFGFVTNIKITDKEGTVKTLSVWDEKVKELQKIKKGTLVEIENIDIRTNNGKKEMHVNGKSSIKKL